MQTDELTLCSTSVCLTGAEERSSLLEERKRLFVARKRGLETSAVIKSVLSL